MEVDDSAAASASGPLGDPPAEEAVVVAPHPWQETLRRTWEETAGKIDLKDLQIGFVSTPEILFEQANKLFEAAHREAVGRTKELLPLPPNNADGSALATEDQPIGTIVWPEEEVRFFGNDEEQNVGDNDGFQMDDLNEMPSFQSDEYICFTGDMCNITQDWNICGIGYESGLSLLSLRVGDAVVLSFPMARNVSDAIAHSFAEE